MHFLKKLKHFREKVHAKIPKLVVFTHPYKKIADKNKTAAQEIVNKF